MPQIEVTVKVDAGGKCSVIAKEQATGRAQTWNTNIQV
jgi:molecular chaperone DnaK (HSP70)